MIESMSEEALAQVQSLHKQPTYRVTLRAAAFQTARNTYANALKALLDEEADKKDGDSANVSLPEDLNFD